MSIEDTVCDADTYRSVPETFKYRGLCVSPLGYCKANPQGNHDRQVKIAVFMWCKSEFQQLKGFLINACETGSMYNKTGRDGEKEHRTV